MEYYEVDLDTKYGVWILYRHAENSDIAHELVISPDINQIFLAMVKDKASRGHGSTVRLG